MVSLASLKLMEITKEIFKDVHLVYMCLKKRKIVKDIHCSMLSKRINVLRDHSASNLLFIFTQLPGVHGEVGLGAPLAAAMGHKLEPELA